MNAVQLEKNLFQIETRYKITYHTEDPVPIPEVIDSLQSLDKILRRTPRFLEAALPGIRIIKTDVLIDKLESGSLKDSFIIRYLFEGDEKNIEKFQEVVDKLMANGSMVGKIVAFAVGGMVMYGVMKALPSGSTAPNINAYNNTIINVGGEVGLESETFKSLLDATSDKKSLARESVKALAPAKQDPKANITFEGYPQLTIPAQAVAEAPAQYEPIKPTEQELTYENVQILIRAFDADNREKGWAGIVPGVTDKRIKFRLEDTVNPEELVGKATTHADIRVYQVYSKSKKEYQVKSIEILKTR